MELTGGGRAGGARGMPGVVVSRPRARGRIRARRGCAPSGSAYRSRAKPPVGWESRSGNFSGTGGMQEGSGRGKTSLPGPAGPGPFSYGNEGRGGAAAWLRCPPSVPRAIAESTGSGLRQSARRADKARGRCGGRSRSPSCVGAGKGRWGGGGTPGRVPLVS